MCRTLLPLLSGVQCCSQSERSTCHQYYSAAATAAPCATLLSLSTLTPPVFLLQPADKTRAADRGPIARDNSCGLSYTAMGFFSRKSSNRPPKDEHPPDHRHSTFGLNNGNAKYNTMSNPAANASIPQISLPRAPDPNLDPAGYLRSIYAVRERSHLVLEKAKKNQLRHFNVDMSKFQDTANYVVSIIKV